MFYISQKNWNKILGYADEAYETEKSEIGGMSVMVEDADNDWELLHPVILEQEISGSNTILDKDALAVYYTQQAKKMGNKNYRFCWWHSHHTMAAFWSNTDLTAIDEFNEGDFSFALVVNLKGEYKFRVSVWSPVEAHQDIDLEVIRPNRCSKKMKEEVKELCSKHSYITSWKKNKKDDDWGYGYNYSRYGYKSKDQLDKEDPRQERIPFRSTAGQTTSSGKNTFTEIVEEVDDIWSDAVDGIDTYKEYKIRIDELNKTLKDENSMYKVELIPESKLGEMLHMWPNQMIIYESTNHPVDISDLGAWGL